MNTGVTADFVVRFQKMPRYMWTASLEGSTVKAYGQAETMAGALEDLMLTIAASAIAVTFKPEGGDGRTFEIK